MPYQLAPSAEFAPGTSLVQFMPRDRGFGEYVGTPTYWGTPAGQAGIRGLGCACGGLCGHCQGFGYFSSGMDYTQWGLAEWGTVFLGLYALIATVFTTSRATRAIRKLPSERRKKKAAELRARAKELTKKR